VLRVYCTPGRDGAQAPVAFVLVTSLPAGLDELRARGIRVVTVDLGIDASWPLGGVKSTSYALNMIAVDRARAAGDDDALFLAREEGDDPEENLRPGHDPGRIGTAGGTVNGPSGLFAPRTGLEKQRGGAASESRSTSGDSRA